MSNEHPSKDLLAEFAFGDNNKDTETHVAFCQECQDYITEIKSISSILETLPDERVPASLQNKIHKSLDNKITPWFEISAIKKFLGPLIISLGFISVILFLYIYVVFVL